MKIGIFSGGCVVHLLAGGGSTYQHTVLTALSKNQGNHTFCLFCDDQNACSLYRGLSVVPLHHFYPTVNDSLVRRGFLKLLRVFDRQHIRWFYKNALHRAIIEHKIDMLWFMIPAYYHIDIPYVITVWDLQHRLQPYFPEVSVSGCTYDARENLYSRALPRASYVLIGNSAGKEEIERFYGLPSWRVRVNPLPTPQFVFDKAHQPTNIFKRFAIRKPYLFYPAQFWPHKNHVTILHAVKQLKDQHSMFFDVVFTGADKGNMRYVKQTAVSLGLHEQVHFLGFVDTEILIDLYKNAFALVYASFFGPDNIPPLEAFGLGCPVIAAQVSGSEYQLKGAALLFNPACHHELTEKIVLLYDNEMLRSDLCAEGLQRAKLYSSEHYVHNILQLFDEFELIRCCWSSTEQYRHL